MTTAPLFDGSLAPHEMTVVDEAFRRSCEALSAGGDRRFVGREGHYARQTVAKMVMGLAIRGELDAGRLSCRVIKHMNAL